MKPTAKQFKDYLREVIASNLNTSWEKTELALFVEETYSDFIERYLD